MDLIGTYTPILTFLEQNNFKKSAQVLKKELNSTETHNRENFGVTDQEKQKSLIKIINKAIQNAQREDKTKMQQLLPKSQASTKIALFTQQETESIMEKLMNRIVSRPDLLQQDEAAAKKIKSFSQNSIFQKLLSEQTQETNNISQTQQNDPRKENINYIEPKEAMQIDQQNFGKIDNNLLEEEDLPAFGGSKQQIIASEQTNPKKNAKTKGKINNQLGDLKNNFDKFDEIMNRQQAKNQQMLESDVYEDLQSVDQKIDGVLNQSFNDLPQNVPSSERVKEQNWVKHENDEYESPFDPGFDLYEVQEAEYANVSKQLSEYYGFPARSIKQTPNQDMQDYIHPDQIAAIQAKPDPKNDDSAEIIQRLSSTGGGSVSVSGQTKGGAPQLSQNDKKTSGGEKILANIKLPSHLKHPVSKDSFYPMEHQGIIFDCFDMKVIFDRERTGFEETKDFPIVINSVIGGRYQIIAFLGSAAFSKAIQCLDLVTNDMVCMKIIENNKDYFDQSIDEIKLLKYININGDVEQNHILKFHDFFYYKEHLFIITELLKDNLYEYQKFNLENEKEKYFTVGHIQKIAFQVLKGLQYLHSLKLLHCDLKPENILMKSYSNCECKIIDFGSSCFVFDHLSTYVQSRSYRAPEVILGCKYGYKIDIWSLGCILAELFTGIVLFQSDSIQGLLSKIVGIIGPFPKWMIKTGRLTNQIFNQNGLIFSDAYENDGSNGNGHQQMFEIPQPRKSRTGKYHIFIPKKTTLKFRLNCEDNDFVEFVAFLLNQDPKTRPDATEALNHPWLKPEKYQDGL